MAREREVHVGENNKSCNMVFKTKPRGPWGRVSDRSFEMIYTSVLLDYNACDCVKFIAREIMIKMRQKSDLLQ